MVIGHDAANVGDADLVTRSTAVPNSNIEVVAASEAGIDVVSRADILSAITVVRKTIAVAGTHGKTTTSSMLTVVLREAEREPSFIIGGEVNEIGSGAAWAESDGWFVVEADESDGTFLALSSSAAIVTSVEPDHLSHYGSETALVEAFETFVEAVDGPSVVCLDDPGAAALARHDGVITYGIDPRSDWVISHYEGGRASSSFILTGPRGESAAFQLATPGLHNARNATAAIVMAQHIGADIESAQRALAKFGGVARRFQFRGELDGITFIDDYAHLPAEVEATLEAAADGGWDRVVCIFQPHRYSRTNDLWSAFASSFTHCELVIVTDIYPAGELPMPGVTGKLVADAILEAEPEKEVLYIPHRLDLRSHLRSELRSGDVCITLGAGDLTTLADEILLGWES